MKPSKNLPLSGFQYLIGMTIKFLTQCNTEIAHAIYCNYVKIALFIAGCNIFA